MKQKTRNYAKRQMTWFRGMRGAEFLEVSNLSPAAVCDMIKKTLANPAANSN
jgi:tRNA A37 N6-isopentenylltransferase MiaA